ncbi:MAG: 30S ribosomal protein S6 [Deltaproteobacteria bacterium]|nr:30S ribosomal protein S6 [Deltaproteobacteria bacterium]
MQTTALREYETLFIVHPELSDENVEGLSERLKEVIAKQKGEVLGSDSWGKRRLAYRAKKQTRGNYVLYHYAGSSGIVDEVERFLRNQEPVMRFLSSAVGVVTDVEARRAEVQKSAKERAERARAAAEREEREQRERERGEREGGRDRDRDNDEEDFE